MKDAQKYTIQFIYMCGNSLFTFISLSTIITKKKLNYDKTNKKKKEKETHTVNDFNSQNDFV